MAIPVPIHAPAAPPDQVVRAIADYAETGIDELIRYYANDPNVLSSVRDVVEQLRTDAKAWGDEIDRLLLAKLGRRRELSLTDGRKLQRYGEPKEVWDDASVKTALAQILAQHAVDTESGEVTLAVEHAERIVGIILAVLGKTKPKKMALKAHRINPDALCAVVWGEDKVRVVDDSDLSHPSAKIAGEGGR